MNRSDLPERPVRPPTPGPAPSPAGPAPARPLRPSKPYPVDDPGISDPNRPGAQPDVVPSPATPPAI